MCWEGAREGVEGSHVTGRSGRRCWSGTVCGLWSVARSLSGGLVGKIMQSLSSGACLVCGDGLKGSQVLTRDRNYPFDTDIGGAGGVGKEATCKGSVVGDLSSDIVT